MDERIPRPRTRPQHAPTARVGMKLEKESKDHFVSLSLSRGRKRRLQKELTLPLEA